MHVLRRIQANSKALGHGKRSASPKSKIRAHCLSNGKRIFAFDASSVTWTSGAGGGVSARTGRGRRRACNLGRRSTQSACVCLRPCDASATSSATGSALDEPVHLWSVRAMGWTERGPRPTRHPPPERGRSCRAPEAFVARSATSACCRSGAASTGRRWRSDVHQATKEAPLGPDRRVARRRPGCLPSLASTRPFALSRAPPAHVQRLLWACSCGAVQHVRASARRHPPSSGLGSVKRFAVPLSLPQSFVCQSSSSFVLLRLRRRSVPNFRPPAPTPSLFQACSPP